MDEVVALHARQPLLNPVEQIGLERAAEALEMLESGKAPGRYVIRF
jgi:D-arabinose 1-dehydrogenase-like Zn-dependent alcohol dehydrogenase